MTINIHIARIDRQLHESAFYSPDIQTLPQLLSSVRTIKISQRCTSVQRQEELSHLQQGKS